MRFFNSLRNSVFAFLGQIITILLGFVVRWVFIHNLGQDYLGVNSVMESMLMILSMTELGIGTSVAFALYKPIDDDDRPKIGALMAFYRKTYHAIGILTLVLGPMLIPFMKFFTKEAADIDGITLIYILFLINTVLSYFFAYKRTLINAYQQSYINSLSEDIFAVIKYILQIVALLFYKSYIGYIVINIVCSVLTNMVISYVCDKKYPFIRQYKSEKLTKEDKAGLKNSIVSLMYQKVGAKLVTGTDNLMISYAKLSLMGIYSNYSMVVSIVSRVVYNVMRSVIGSVGNLMVQEDKQLKYKVYEEFVFATFIFYFFISIGFSACLERFIELWAGTDWVLSPLVTFVVILNFFLMGMRQPNVVVIEAAGLFNKMRMKAVGEVVVNLVVSFLFLVVFKLGIYGVLFGTTVSMVTVCIWWEIMAVHKYTLDASAGKYTRDFIGYILTAFVGCMLSYYVSSIITINGFAGLILSGLCAVGIFAVMIFVLYSKTRVFKALIGRFLKK